MQKVFFLKIFNSHHYIDHNNRTYHRFAYDVKQQVMNYVAVQGLPILLQN